MAGAKAEIGIFGGTGLYTLLEDAEEVAIDTPYGPPSARVAIGTIGGRSVAFLPRHGVHHEYPPHRINYRANLYAFKELGVQRILAATAAGSLQPHVRVGDFVVCDQFVNFTHHRVGTFYDGPVTTHIGMADPYCPELRAVVIEAGRRLGLPLHERGTAVVIEGPRFSTRAESRFFSAQGWEVINMTQYPEVVLARELEICYANISIITDYDVGLEGHPEVKPVSHEEVVRVFQKNLGRLKDLLNDVVPKIPVERKCPCKDALKTARL
jgi:5'-methylthioadenosine phosphorylase